MKRHLILFLHTALFLMLCCILPTGCKTVKIDAEAPEREPFTGTAIPPRISSISLPISVSVREVANMLNREYPHLLYKDDNLEDDNIAITVTKNRPIELNAENDQLYINLPLHIWVKGLAEWEPCSFCPTLSQSKSTEFDIVIKAQSSLSLTEGWGINTKTTANYNWGRQKPSLDIGPVSIPLSSIIDRVLQPRLKTMTADLDKMLAQQVNLKSYVKDAWMEVQDPILLDETYQTWMVIRPQQVKVSSLKAQLDELSMKLGIASYIDVAIGNKPVVDKKIPLPKLIQDNNITDDFNVGIVGDISYAKATELAKKTMIGETYSFEGGKYMVTINDIEIYGSGSKLHMRLNIDGKPQKGKAINANIYLAGVPYYDTTNGSIRMRDLDYDIKSKNALAKAAGWLAETAFSKRIQQETYFELGDYMKEYKQMVQEGLDENGKLAENVWIKGDIKELVPENVYLTAEGIKAVVMAKGNLRLLVRKM